MLIVTWRERITRWPEKQHLSAAQTGAMRSKNIQKLQQGRARTNKGSIIQIAKVELY